MAMTVSCRDCDTIPKVADAGRVLYEGERRVQIMHNGVRVLAGAYHGAWMEEVIRRLHGHHEPQEERVFYEIVQRLARSCPSPFMVESGSFWAYYSLWLRRAVPATRNLMIEPDPHNLEVGRDNFRLNGATGRFLGYAVGRRSTAPAPFRCESDGVVRNIPRISIGDLVGRERIDRIDLLLADLQGPELDMLHGANHLFREGRLRFLVLSTHHHAISGSPVTHQRCLEFILARGAHIIAEHAVSESFSGDGLIAASLDPRDTDLRVPITHNRASASLFGGLEEELATCRDEVTALRAELERFGPSAAQAALWPEQSLASEGPSLAHESAGCGPIRARRWLQRWHGSRVRR